LVSLVVGAIVTPVYVHAETEQVQVTTATTATTASTLLAQQAQLGAALSALRALAMSSPPEALSDEQIELYTQVMADVASFVEESSAAGALLNDQLQGLEEATQEQLERVSEQLAFQSEGVQIAMDRVAKWLQSSGRSLRKVAENIQKILDLLK
jgi:ABC-type transporter Mla subunit MlaD